MYKIYINQHPVFLLSKTESNQLPPNIHQVQYKKKKTDLAKWIKKLEKETEETLPTAFIAKELKPLKKDFWSHYKVVEAGGGIVFNKQEQILSIFRRGHWDLPKGKQESNETMEQTALREVEEETGISNLSLDHFVANTYHTFKNKKKKRILKISVWYRMRSEDTDLTPQTEEDIEQVEWLSKEELLQKTPIYPNIVEVLQQL